MKVLGAQRLAAFYSHVQSHADIVVSGYSNAGIVEANENYAAEAKDLCRLLSEAFNTV